jgi:hypothetical protein
MNMKLSGIFAAVILLTTLTSGQTGSQKPAALFEQPLLLTSAGQNAEVQIAAVLAKRAGLNYTLSKFATGADLNNMKTLVLVLGTSLKGLGAAGLDLDKERQRISALIAAAQKGQIPLLCLHLGGEVRRGPQTDELISEILPMARMAIVVKSGNADGIFTKICQAKNIPLIEVEKTADVQISLREVFQ